MNKEDVVKPIKCEVKALRVRVELLREALSLAINSGDFTYATEAYDHCKNLLRGIGGDPLCRQIVD